tara:strand:+ start:1701 stop:2705 length:1005 start_codon:yes stop_codon:yes gene_type:complete
MKEEILLSICIPTYDRVAILEPILDSIFQNLNYDWLEVVVVDDNSEKQILSPFFEYEQKWKNFKYVKNPIRLGVVRNITNCLELSKGKYVTLLKDTDYINHELVLKLKDDLILGEVNSVFTEVSFKEKGVKYSYIKKDKRVKRVKKIRDVISVYRSHGTPGFILKKEKIDFFFLKNNEMDPANIYAQTMAGIMVALKGSVMFVKSDLNLIRLSPAHSNLASYYTKNNSNSNWNLELKLPYSHPKNSIIILKYFHNKLNVLASELSKGGVVVKKMIGYQLAYHYIYAISNFDYSNQEKREYFISITKIKGVKFYFIYYFSVKYLLKLRREFFKKN